MNFNWTVHQVCIHLLRSPNGGNLYASVSSADYAPQSMPLTNQWERQAFMCVHEWTTTCQTFVACRLPKAIAQVCEQHANAA
jgi:hypothetical protein